MTIELYTLPNCKGCTQVKEMLNDWAIPYVEYDLKKPENHEARKVWRALGLNIAPILICKKGDDENIITDFDFCTKLFLQKYID